MAQDGNYWSGQGGDVVVDGTTHPVAEWQLSKSAVLADSTTSASGCKKRKKVLGDTSFTMNMPWDSDETPEELGLEEGAEIDSIKLYLGESGLMHSFAGIVEKVDVVCDAKGDIIRETVSGYAQE